MDVTGLKIFVFINAMIFAFITFVTNTPLWGKTLLKSEKNILQISHLFQSAVVFIEYLFSKKGQDTKHVLRFCSLFSRGMCGL